MRDDLDLDIVRRLAAHRATKMVPAKMPAKILVVKPMYAAGRYIPPSIARIIDLVAHQSDVSPESIRGTKRYHRLVNARFAIANLAADFAPRQSDRAVDDAMLRGVGLCRYYRERHADRAVLYPDYKALFERCQAELRRGVSP